MESPNGKFRVAHGQRKYTIWLFILGIIAGSAATATLLAASHVHLQIPLTGAEDLMSSFTHWPESGKMGTSEESTNAAGYTETPSSSKPFWTHSSSTFRKFVNGHWRYYLTNKGESGGSSGATAQIDHASAGTEIVESQEGKFDGLDDVTGGDIMEEGEHADTETWRKMRDLALKTDDQLRLRKSSLASDLFGPQNDTLSDFSLQEMVISDSSSKGKENLVGSKAKIAFLFLTRGPMPLDILWDRFFASADPELYTVYMHPTPGFSYNESTTTCSAFHGREIESVQVEWGQMSVVDAERRLLASAMADPLNTRFVLLSESCLPLRNFDYIRAYLLSNEKSYLDSFRDTQNRYNPSMMPLIPPWKWRKGTQWFALTREHARLFVEDQEYYNSFREYCKVDCASPSNARGCRTFCAPDEHYKQTLIALLNREHEIERRAVTFANWWPVNRMHPKLYVVQEVSPELLQKFLDTTEHWRPLEGGNIGCGTAPMPEGFQNQKADYTTQLADRQKRPCWLFGRKFTQKSGLRISGFASSIMGY